MDNRTLEELEDLLEDAQEGLSYAEHEAKSLRDRIEGLEELLSDEETSISHYEQEIEDLERAIEEKKAQTSEWIKEDA